MRQNNFLGQRRFVIDARTRCISFNGVTLGNKREFDVVLRHHAGDW
jgi:hypothetical protein